MVGNGFLLPAGPLRERLNKIKSCGIAVINGKRNISFEKKLKLISKHIKIFQSKYEVKHLKKFKGKQFFAFAGIGNPDNFFNLLKEHGLKIKEKVSIEDILNNFNVDEIENKVKDKVKDKLKKLIN